MLKLINKKGVKATLMLAWPIMLGQMGQILTGIVDSLMVGQISPAHIAAASFGHGVFIIPMTFLMGFILGLSPLVAEADGKKDVFESKKLFKNGVLLYTTIAILLSVLLFLFTPVLGLMKQPTEVVFLASTYFEYLVWSMIPLALFLAFKQFAEGLSFTKVAMMVLVGGNILNIALNYVFIFGKYGAPRMELDGAGLATLLSRILMMVIIILYIYLNKNFKQFRLKLNLSLVETPVFKKLLNIGVPIGFQYIFEAGAFVFAGIMVGWFGTKALAAHQIAIVLASFSYMCIVGLASATTVRVGNAIGRKNILQVREAVTTSQIICTSIEIGFLILFFLLAELLPTYFTQDGEVIKIAAQFIIIAGIFQLSDGFQAMMQGILRGMNDVKTPSIIAFASYWIVGLPFSYLLSHTLGIGPQGVWYGLLIGLTVSAILLYLRYRFSRTILDNKFQVR